MISEQNNSKGHIFLNSIGGRKTVSNFICKKCNNTTGGTWDTEVDKYLSKLAIYFQIKRHRGKVPSQKIVLKNGNSYYLHINKLSSDKLEHQFDGSKLWEVHLAKLAENGLNKVRETLKVRRKNRSSHFTFLQTVLLDHDGHQQTCYMVSKTPHYIQICLHKHL